MLEPVLNSTHVCSNVQCLDLRPYVRVRDRFHKPNASLERELEAAMLRDVPTSSETCPAAMVIACSNTPLGPDNLLRRSVTALGLPILAPTLPHGLKALRRHVYLDLLKKLSHCERTAFLLLDSSDSFMRCDANEIAERVRSFGPDTAIVSAERHFDLQINPFKGQFDRITASLNDSTPYMYVNSGGLGGFHRAMLRFERSAAGLGPPPFSSRGGFLPDAGKSDQSPVAEVVLRDLLAGNTSSTLDRHTHLFYTPTMADWDYDRAVARIRHTNPCVVHVPNKMYKSVLWRLWNTTGPNGAPGVHSNGEPRAR